MIHLCLFAESRYVTPFAAGSAASYRITLWCRRARDFPEKVGMSPARQALTPPVLLMLLLRLLLLPLSLLLITG